MRRCGMRSVVAVAVALVGVVSVADAAVLCQKGNGALFVRTACKKKETAVDATSIGMVGPKGDKGDKGDTGDAGANLTAQTVLPSGQSESGMFSAGGANDTVAGYIGAGITYVQPLAMPIADDHIIDVQGVGPVTHCAGPGQADPGYLCLYNNIYNGVDVGYGYSDDAGYFSTPSAGVVLYWTVLGADAYAGGQYTVTAP
jgi:hypothetical protein